MIKNQNGNKQKNPNQTKKSSSLMWKNVKNINQSLEYVIDKD